MWAGTLQATIPSPLRSWSFARFWHWWGPGGGLGWEEGGGGFLLAGLGPVTVTLAAAAAVGSDPKVPVPLLRGLRTSRAGFPLDVRALATLSGLQPPPGAYFWLPQHLLSTLSAFQQRHKQVPVSNPLCVQYPLWFLLLPTP